MRPRYLVGFFFFFCHDPFIHRTMFCVRKKRSTYTYPVPPLTHSTVLKSFPRSTGCCSAHVPTGINPDRLSCSLITSKRRTVNNNNIVVVIRWQLLTRVKHPSRDDFVLTPISLASVIYVPEKVTRSRDGGKAEILFFFDIFCDVLETRYGLRI